jgi:hypothetical protein
MKKTEMALCILTLLYHTPSFAMDTDETNSGSVPRIKFSKKQVKSSKKPSIETPVGWYSANSKIKLGYTQTTEIGDFKGGTLYGYIDPSFADSQWQMALAKGFTKTAKGTNGVKFINNNVLELKINADERLYTTEVHKNDLGDYIAIFDREARHKEMTKIANTNKFKIYTDCFANFGNGHDQAVECR